MKRAELESRLYEIWEREPAPNRGGDWSLVKAGGTPFDADWETWSTPIGNGYMGANLFGRTDTERIQISDKTLYNEGIYFKRGGLTGFAELYLTFDHQEVRNYRRSLNLNEAIARVGYDHGGVRYTREAFMSYPDNVLVVRVSADRAGAVTCVVKAEIPHLEKDVQRTGRVTVESDLIMLAGRMAHLDINYEAQIKVLHEGGALTPVDGGVAVAGADAVTLVMALGTNYSLGPHLFQYPPFEARTPDGASPEGAPSEPERRSDAARKLDPDVFPHEAVSARIAGAVAKGFDTLRRDHLADYQSLFGRVDIMLGSQTSGVPTSVLLEQYKAGEANTWLEELMFQYGRYLLIASSREQSLPAHLQGVWSHYYLTPWTGGYWHNINVQMNYWGACSANLAETFQAYIHYFNAYYPRAAELADAYVRQHNPAAASEEAGGNGWIIGTGANAYNIVPPGGHSGPGTGGFTAKLFTDYYLFTRDRDVLREVAYPALLGMSRFFSKALNPDGEGRLLVCPSASPEQMVHDRSQLEGMPGHLFSETHPYYITTGCAFDQGFVWETYHDTLLLAEVLGEEDAFLDVIREQITRLDPILVGASGQIKEFREENTYSDIGDPLHRHISHLCPLYPGTLINQRKEWEQAAETTLDLRGNKTTGWALAHRMNCLARLGAGAKAYRAYQELIRERTAPNLWTLHPPFQIDANLGAMAGVVEMLQQSHQDFIELLPALPDAWKEGSFSGLVARGNFVISAEWKEGRVTHVTIESRSGGRCCVRFPGADGVVVSDEDGRMVERDVAPSGSVVFATEPGRTYTMTPGA